VKKHLIIFIGIILLVSACNKKLGPEPPYPEPQRILVDSFEDADDINNILFDGGLNKWETDRVFVFGIAGPGTITPSSGGSYGAYCYSMTGTVTANKTGSIIFKTGLKRSGDSGTNLAKRSMMKFSLAVASNAPTGVSHICNLYIMTKLGGGLLFDDVSVVPDGQWHDYAVSLSDKYESIGDYAVMIMHDAYSAMWAFCIETGNDSDTADLEVKIDNVSFE
jgi:hypothetical protein